MILLNVPYAEKDQARQLGAHWDAGVKKWYVPAGTLATPFERWLPAGDWLAKNDKAKPGKKARKKGATRRADDAEGVVIVGPNYRPVEGATGLPWE